MRCRQCGTEIADKALICYRCGTATTEAKFKAPAAANRGVPSRRWWIAGLVVVLIVAAMLFFVFFGSRFDRPSGRLDFDDRRQDARSSRLDVRGDRIDLLVAAA